MLITVVFVYIKIGEDTYIDIFSHYNIQKIINFDLRRGTPIDLVDLTNSVKWTKTKRQIIVSSYNITGQFDRSESLLKVRAGPFYFKNIPLTNHTEEHPYSYKTKRIIRFLLQKYSELEITEDIIKENDPSDDESSKSSIIINSYYNWYNKQQSEVTFENSFNFPELSDQKNKKDSRQKKK